MKFGKNTYYTGSIYDIGFTKDEASEILNKYMNNNNPDNNKFLHALLDGVRIDDIATSTGLTDHTVHSWLSDIIPTMFIEKNKMNKEKYEEIQQDTCYTNSDFFDIYEYAETMDADYYDFNTGYIYHIQDYNRAKKYGIPTAGIAVTCDGEFLGYAQKLN